MSASLGGAGVGAGVGALCRVIASVSLRLILFGLCALFGLFARSDGGELTARPALPSLPTPPSAPVPPPRKKRRARSAHGHAHPHGGHDPPPQPPSRTRTGSRLRDGDDGADVGRDSNPNDSILSPANTMELLQRMAKVTRTEVAEWFHNRRVLLFTMY